MRAVVLTTLVFALLPVCFVRPWIGVLVWSWLGYMNPHRLTWGFAYALPFAQLVALATLGGLLFAVDRRRVPKTIESGLLFALWTQFLLSTLFAAYPDEAWPQFVKVSKILLMTVVTLWLFQDPGKLKALVWVIAVSLGFFGLKGGIWGILTGSTGHVLGPPGSFIEGNTEIGLALLMTLPLLLFLRRHEPRARVRRLLLVTFGFTIVAIIFTYSRGAFLGLAAVLAVLALKSRTRVTAIAFLLVAYLFADAIIPQRWFDRMSTIRTEDVDDSSRGRLNAWYVGYRLALDNPLVGAGFRPFTRETFDRYLPDYGRDYDAHSIYFQILGEHGFVGLGLFLGLVAATLLSLRRLIRQASSAPGSLWIGDLAQMLEASLVGYLVAGAFLSLCYFDLFYHLVAMVAVLKTLAATPQPPAAAHSRPARPLLTLPRASRA